jgi:ATP-binding cassette subfamily B protein/subfamily B ATP-binding cassette protein MsbA
MKNLFRVLLFFQADTPHIGLAVGLLILSTGANLLKPWPLALIVDSLLGNQPWPAWLAHWTAGWEKGAVLGLLVCAILLFQALQAALSTAHNYLLIQAGLRGLARVRYELFSWLQRLSLRFHQGTNQGDVIYRACWDTYAFQTLFQHGLFGLIGAAFSLGLMLTIMWRLNWLLTLVILGTVPLLLLVMRCFGRAMRQHSLAAHQADSRVTSLVQQAIVALPLTQSCVREEHEQCRFSGQVSEALRRRLSQHGWELGYLAVIAIIFALGIAGIAWQGTQQVWAGRLSLGQLLVFLAYLGQFYEPLNQLSRLGATVADASAGAQRVLEILDAPEEVKESPDARAAVARGEIEFDRVSFAYQPDRLVLREVTFQLAAGESAALIGPNGAGKSTLLHLLPRFFDPTSGAVRMDGVNLQAWRLKELRRQVALVLQEAPLLPATIAENIAYGKPDATPAEIEAAARAAYADRFIGQLPQQYETLVGECATRLSAGEKQRLNLARAFLKAAPILVLDEPTGALDAESQALVAASLRDLMRGRTTLIVTHHPATIGQVDKILVLENGRLIEVGTPKELRQRSEYYARLI